MAHELQPEAGDKSLTVSCYWVAKPGALFMAAQAAMAAVTVAFFSWLVYGLSIHRSIEGSVPIVLALLGCQVCLYFHKLHHLAFGTDWRLFLAKALQSLSVAIGLLLTLFLLFPGFPREDNASIVVLLTSTLVVVALRPVAHWLVRNRRLGEGILILGDGEIGLKLYRQLTLNSPGRSFAAQTERVLITPDSSIETARIGGGQLRDIIGQSGVSRIILAEPDAQRRQEVSTALLECRLGGITIEDAVDFYERVTRKIWLEGIHPEWLIHSDGFRPSRLYMGVKRALDGVGAVLLIAATAPLMALLAAAIRLESSGPALFRQERVGLNGRRFILWKFRSMRHDAEAETGPTWSTTNDDRITRVGRFIRKYRLDELPQAFNVLAGEMSFVGPRPERPYFVELLREEIPYYDIRHFVKPGITGWAQVMYPYGSTIEDAYEKLQYELYYAKHISLAMDFLTLVKTLKVVLFGRGQ